MKTRFAPVADPAPFLSVEIWNVIFSFVEKSADSPSHRQADLYSCCLVSRTCYQAAVPKLYDSPYLHNANARKFATTLVQPTTLKARSLGLEVLVRSLDMYQMGYSLSPSENLRLLRRVSSGLQQLVAPSVSFPSSALATLSKCLDLVRVDFSNLLWKNVQLHQLLRATRDLSRLRSMKLPIAIFHFTKLALTDLTWPPALECVHTGGVRYNDLVLRWDEIASCWPQSLQCLHFQALYQPSHWNTMYYHEPSIPTICDGPIQTLVLNDCALLGVEFLRVASFVKVLTVPLVQLDELETITSRDRENSYTIQQLIVTQHRTSSHDLGQELLDLILYITTLFTNLWQVRLEDISATTVVESESSWKMLDQELKSRLPPELSYRLNEAGMIFGNLGKDAGCLMNVDDCG